MDCVDMLNSLNYYTKNQNKKRKRDDIIMINNEDYSKTIDIFTNMSEKLLILEEKVKNLEDENQKKNDLLNKIAENYLTKENLKKIKIYSNFEINNHDYFS